MSREGPATHVRSPIFYSLKLPSFRPSGLTTLDRQRLFCGMNETESTGVRRRPIRARQTGWAHSVAGFLTRAGVQPNQISLGSVVCALLGAAALVGSGAVSVSVAVRVALLLGAAGCIQLRLLCNLFDGLVAVEGGRRTRTGEIYNELPDRVSDLLLLGAAGHACRGHGAEFQLGWAVAALAIAVAYVRALGGQLGASPQFCGPMAKQQRMAVLTTACVTASAETLLGWPIRTMTWALVVIALGSIVTAIRRTVRIARELESRP